MPESLSSISAHWFWLTLAAILGAAEMLAPGFFLIWLALAAAGVLVGPYALGLVSDTEIVPLYVGPVVRVGRRLEACSSAMQDNQCWR